MTTPTNGTDPMARVLAAITQAQAGDAQAPYGVLSELAALDPQQLASAKRSFKEALGKALNLRDLAVALKKEHGNGGEDEDPESSRGGYLVRYGRAGTPFLYWQKQSADGVVEVMLAHFVPTITAERLRHKANGESLRVFTVELQLPRGTRTMELVSEQIADDRSFYTACVNAAGGDLILATLTAKKHLAEAAKSLALPDRPRSEVYEFTGWQEHDGRLVYLTTAGAIGTTEPLAVDLANLALGTGVPALATFGPRDDGDEALATALAGLAGPVRGAFSDGVTLPGLAAVFLAPLDRWASKLSPDRTGMHYIGTTGVRKSALLGILQAFYGIPEPIMSWRGTANSIEIGLSPLRDALVTVDDLKVGTSDRGAAVKIKQSYADRRGRSRATRTGELAQARFVGGLLISAGEDTPSGEASATARDLYVPIGVDDARLDKLSEAQALAASLPTLTARYIGWIIERQDQIGATMTQIFTEARARYRQLLVDRKGLNDAGRVAVSCALLETGAAIGCQWLQEAGWTPAAAREWLEATQDALAALAIQQAEAIGEESAALAFLRALRALLDSRRAELAHVDEGKSLPDLAGCAPTAPAAVMIGWRQGETLLLQPDLVLSEVRQWQSRQGQRVEITKRGLYAQLRDGGWLAMIDPEGKTEVKKRIGGRSQRVLALRAAALDDGDAVSTDEVNF